MSEPTDPQKDLGGKFAPLFNALRTMQQRFRPGRPYIPKDHHYTQRPPALRKAVSRRRNKAARLARRHNRRPK